MEVIKEKDTSAYRYRVVVTYTVQIFSGYGYEFTDDEGWDRVSTWSTKEEALKELDRK